MADRLHDPDALGQYQQRWTPAHDNRKANREADINRMMAGTEIDSPPKQLIANTLNARFNVVETLGVQLG